MYFFLKAFFSRCRDSDPKRISTGIIKMVFKRTPGLFLLAALGVILLLSSCAPVTTVEEPTLQPTSTPENTATPTIVWFPPTSTPTVLPTRAITPTPIMNTGIGEVLYSDLLADSTGWETGQNNIGIIAYDDGGLTLAVSAPTSTLTSLRTDIILNNFYLEVTAKPNLCRNEDAYGVMVRSNSRFNTYRFVIACNGMIRVERLKNGEVVLLQNWKRSGQLPFGAPLSVRLGIWAYAKELRFFINDVYQFSTTDPVWSSGQVGFFARSNDETAVSVSFTEFEIRQINSQNSVAPTATSEGPILDEEMDH